MTSNEQPPDPRPALFSAIEKAGELLGKIDSTHLSRPTPCDDFSVEDLGRHVVHVADRLNQLGQGSAWDELPQTDDTEAADFSSVFAARSKEVVTTWSEPEAYAAIREVPWGAVPGAGCLVVYVPEFVTHSWDLAAAIGVDLNLDDEIVRAAFETSAFLPEDARGGPDAPFGPRVHVADDAPLLLQVAGAMGRDVTRWSGPIQ